MMVDESDYFQLLYLTGLLLARSSKDSCFLHYHEVVINQSNLFSKTGKGIWHPSPVDQKIIRPF